MPNFSVTINITKAKRTPESVLQLLKLTSDNEVIANGLGYYEPVSGDVCQVFTYLNVTPEQVIKIKRRLRAGHSYLDRHDAIRSWN